MSTKSSKTKSSRSNQNSNEKSPSVSSNNQILISKDIYMDEESSDSNSKDIDYHIFSKDANNEGRPKVHLLNKPTRARRDVSNNQSGFVQIKEEFQDPDMSFQAWDSKQKKPENINGNSKKSGVLFELMENQISFRVKREFRKLMLNLTQKYKENELNLDHNFKSTLVETCVDFTRRLKSQSPNKKVFMRPLFVAVSYCLMRAECKDNDFLVELRDIMDFVNPQNSRKFKTKMVLFYLKEFKALYKCNKMRMEKSFLTKRPSMDNEEETQKEDSLTDARKIKQIFRIAGAIFKKLSRGKEEFQKFEKEVLIWTQKIFYFREGLIQTLLCKKVKNVGLGLLFLALTIMFPHQQMNLTDFLDQVNQKSMEVNAKSGKIRFIYSSLLYYQVLILQK
jgi:hypothetical protein